MTLSPDKLCSREAAAECAQLLPRPLVFVHGLFDLVDRSVVTYLSAARQLGATLVVGLRSDASAAGLADAEAPRHAALDRAWVLDALEPVTMIVLFDEASPAALMRELRPDVHVLPDDEVPSLEEAQLVQSWGGRVAALPCAPALPAALRQPPRGRGQGPGYPRIA
ncbi:D-glycero-beta-D-manno-heptose 1-phosphate adenylyltransferase [Ideonella sp. BN130291]|uniref:D-glycero-beta-D-manno-heptose 1-phosphate adenylyltransferase n=1 Tax=Ideonella sp. BN130291 TaxID=3112940 RepID=UPI002E26B2DF|nr:D-glycero-beta-D-manno-heptose 1-phosphate adenylyltransferase [Ideonella sp. BN130291]